MALKPYQTVKTANKSWSVTQQHGFDDSIFKTFTKDKAKRKKSKAARKARKLNRK